MNKYQRALKVLSASEQQAWKEGYDVYDFQEAKDLLKELVEKATSKEPLFYSNDQGKDFWCCPTCRGHLANDTEEFLCGDYCPRCGQALKWGEEEKDA